MRIYQAMIRPAIVSAGRELPFLLLLLLPGAAALPLFSPQLVEAQTTISGELAGNITDVSGAVIPNAKVTIKNTATGASQSTTSGGDGSYRFSLLQPGQNAVTARENGFQTAE